MILAPSGIIKGSTVFTVLTNNVTEGAEETRETVAAVAVCLVHALAIVLTGRGGAVVHVTLTTGTWAVKINSYKDKKLQGL